ncbi:Endoglucanase E-like protein, SGNH hydrolase family [Bombilactobacillus mellis]|uniref:Endoglucanase E-like protein, SGNH hydrolase family n=1 Tax=Bombilactobacillus mellis TaxID=1218508 RepID=A0A0F4KQH6_9LACO|nr:GDSL-type esterase/lipase family protein [Bombilactobacillus mellis]KJY48264.1 Endoglucanase E-like protein, SGNH hydrolase family [Bombilactobacillus mellis]
MQVQTTQANFAIPGVYFSGRWAQLADNQGVYTSNLGAQIYFQVEKASQIELFFTTTATAAGVWLAYQVDQKPYQRVNLAHMPLKIVLPDEQRHTLRIVYSGNTPRDNVWKRQGGLCLQKIHCNQEAILTPVKPVGRPITFIGDSITAGSWLHGTTAGRDYCAEGNYAALVANQLNLEDIRIAYPGAGVLKPGSGSVPAAAQFLEQVDADHFWQVQPSQYVVINLGTTDRKANEIIFRAAFELLLEKIQLLYPQTPKLVMIPFSQQHAQVIREESREYPQTRVLETATWNLTYTDGLHPDAAATPQIVNHVLAALKQLAN